MSIEWSARAVTCETDKVKKDARTMIAVLALKSLILEANKAMRVLNRSCLLRTRPNILSLEFRVSPKFLGVARSKKGEIQ